MRLKIKEIPLNMRLKIEEISLNIKLNNKSMFSREKLHFGVTGVFLSSRSALMLVLLLSWLFPLFFPLLSAIITLFMLSTLWLLNVFLLRAKLSSHSASLMLSALQYKLIFKCWRCPDVLHSWKLNNKCLLKKLIIVYKV